MTLTMIIRQRAHDTCMADCFNHCLNHEFMKPDLPISIKGKLS
jgi:hypothetical protein